MIHVCKKCQKRNHPNKLPTRWFKPWPFHPRSLEVTEKPTFPKGCVNSSQKHTDLTQGGPYDRYKLGEITRISRVITLCYPFIIAIYRGYNSIYNCCFGPIWEEGKNFSVFHDLPLFRGPDPRTESVFSFGPRVIRGTKESSSWGEFSWWDSLGSKFGNLSTQNTQIWKASLLLHSKVTYFFGSFGVGVSLYIYIFKYNIYIYNIDMIYFNMKCKLDLYLTHILPPQKNKQPIY